MGEKVEIRVTEEFSKCYKNLPKKIQKMNNEWEFYVNLYYRCIFLREGNKYILLTLGGHKIVDK